MRSTAPLSSTRRLLVAVGLSLLILPQEAPAGADRPAPEPVPVTSVLVSDAIPVALPAFHESDRSGVAWADLLQEMPALPGTAWPAADREFAGPDHAVSWRTVPAPDGQLTLRPDKGGVAHYLAYYVTLDRWQKLTFAISGDQALQGRVDREELEFTETGGQGGAPTTRTAELGLAVGKHLVVLRTLRPADSTGDWNLGLSVTPDSLTTTMALGTSPDHAVDIHTILDAPRVGNVSLSADGALAAISLSAYRNGKDKESWLEVRDTRQGKLVRLWRGSHAPGGVQWRPGGHRLAWQTQAGDAASIRTFDFDSGETAVVLADVAHLGQWRWAPDGKSIIYAITHEPEVDKRRVKQVLYPADRQPGWRQRSHLSQVFIPTGVTRRLTAGPVSAAGWEISPDGSRMVFFTSEQDLTARPYFTSELWLLDLKDLALKKLLADPWISAAAWSPNGKQLLLQGSPSAFDGLGRNLPDGVPANDYGGQLYVYDLATGESTAVSLNLRPDVDWATWSPADGMIYARTTDTQYNPVWRWKPGRDAWEKIGTGVDVTRQIAVARAARIAVARGSSATAPNTVQVIDLAHNRSRLLLDPGSAWYRDTVFGKVENWVAHLDKGMDLDGFVYYPPGFDPARTYPLIVYYYGGTVPITRDFGGRYPKNIWAGQGYVVYVPNPSGATGYGQEFAARHVNDWGKLTAPEVIEGTRKFLAAHPYIDATKVGCMGASYGGFLTDYIITQTDLFAAAVSHAGISDISSYWGEGLWGYDYGARALANSFPWSDTDFFVAQSPLFQAENVTTPLLLVQGDADVNVPKGESDQFFTALKLLGREVQYVQILGQDHHILDHDQRIVWNDTILAFLAKYLKGQPEWWEALYPPAEDYR